MLFDRFAPSDDGRAILAEAERIDRFLDTWAPERRDAAEALERAILERKDSARTHRSARVRRAWGWGATAAIVVLGFALGVSQALREPVPDPVAQLIFGPTNQRGAGL